MFRIPGHEGVPRERQSSRNGNFILGIDIGTSSVKLAVVDSNTGNIIQSGYKPTKQSIGFDDKLNVPGSDLQDVLQLFRLVRSCLSVLDNHLFKGVSHVAICGQMHGIVLWKSADIHSDRPTVSPLFTWQDQRCSEEFIQNLPRADSHLRIATGYGCATIFWLLEHCPEYLPQFDRCGTVMDFVAIKLSSPEINRPQMSPQNAASWGYFNPVTNQWNTHVLQNSGFPVDILPDIGVVGDDMSVVAANWANISQGTKIKVPLGDLQCSVRATIENPHTDAVVNISTSAQISFVKESGFVPPKQLDSQSTVEYLPYESDTYLATAASINGGNVLDSFVKTLQQWSAFLLKQDEPQGVPKNQAGVIPKRGFTQDEIWNKLKKAASEQPFSELEIDPCIFGERHDANKRGSVSNIGAENCYHLGSVVVALYRGIAQNLSSMCPKETLKQNGLSRIVGSGSCLIRNPGLSRAIEDTFGMSVVEASSKEDLTCLSNPQLRIDFNNKGNACVGAALFAMDSSQK